MLKNVSQLFHTIEGKVYHFTCDMDSPLAHVIQCLNEFINYANQIEAAVKEAQSLQQSVAPVSSVEPVAPSEQVVQESPIIVPIVEPVSQEPKN